MIKNLFASIPFQRLVVYFVILALLPFLLVTYGFIKARSDCLEVRKRIDQVRLFALEREQKQAVNQEVRRLYAQADSLYLDQSLEILTFLKKEKDALEQLFQSPTFTGNEAAESRYLFITGEENRIKFSETMNETKEGIQEAVAVFAHPIEIDGTDLKEILTRIEGKRAGQPQLIISDFKLIKKSLPLRSEVYELHLKLLKREFLA